MSAPGKVSLPKISAAFVTGVLLACGASACSGDGRSSSPSPESTAAATAQPNTATTSRTLPSVGEVVVQKEPHQGNVIRDRATGGKRFFLSGIQAGECLSFLRANPGAAGKDVRAACPGEVVEAMVQKQIASQARKKHR